MYLYWLIEYRFTFKDVQKNQFSSCKFTYETIDSNISMWNKYDIFFTRLLYFKNYIYFTRLKFKKLMIPKPINQIRIPWRFFSLFVFIFFFYISFEFLHYIFIFCIYNLFLAFLYYYFSLLLKYLYTMYTTHTMYDPN